MQLLPDWCKPRSLVLVWPEGLSSRDCLVPFYREFIRMLPAGTGLTLIVKFNSLSTRLNAELKAVNPSITIDFFAIPGVHDIWIRDWAPLPALNDSGEIVACKPVYDPNYNLPASSRADDQAGETLVEMFDYPLKNFNIIWDGGNITHNGRGTGIVSRRLLADNRKYSRMCFNYLLHELIQNVNYISEEPGDVTGHVDGMIRFLDESTLLVGAYPEHYHSGENLIVEREWAELRKFMDDLANLFSRDFRIIRVTNAIPRNMVTAGENVPSAFGNYINFLRYGSYVFLPQYGVKEDEAALAVFNKYFGSGNVIIISYDIDKLAQLGGVLNCISWVAF